MTFTEKIGTKISAVKIGNLGDTVAIGVGDGTVAFFKESEGSIVSNTLKYHTTFITSLIFNSDDSRCCSSAYEKIVYVWDSVNFKKADKIKTVHNSAINKMISADGGFVSVGNDATINKWKYEL